MFEIITHVTADVGLESNGCVIGRKDECYLEERCFQNTWLESDM